MAYDYNEYMKNYNKKNVVMVSVRLNRSKDKDIIEALNSEGGNKNECVKRLVRMGLRKKSI